MGSRHPTTELLGHVITVFMGQLNTNSMQRGALDGGGS